MKRELNIIYMRMWQWGPQDFVGYEEWLRGKFEEPIVDALRSGLLKRASSYLTLSCRSRSHINTYIIFNTFSKQWDPQNTLHNFFPSVGLLMLLDPSQKIWAPYNYLSYS